MRRPILALLALLPALAGAHQAGLSHGEWRLDGDRLSATLRLPTSEVAAAWPDLLARASREPAPLARAIAGQVVATRGNLGCSPLGAVGGPDGPDGVRLIAAWSCPGGGPVAVHLGFLAALPPGHVHLARVEADGPPREEVADGRRDEFSIEPAGSAWAGLARLVGLGVEHILSGWDHLAFLFALLLASARIRGVLAVVTGFTVGHAITLALATLGAVTAPASIVEPLIAASVVVVAAQNLRELRSGAASGHARWPLAATFGLVHGFGFAGALAELQLPRAGLAASLLSFNLGVELGQAMVVAAVFPVLILVRRRPRLAAAGLPMGSLAVGCAGLIWLVQRVGGGLGG